MPMDVDTATAAPTVRAIKNLEFWVLIPWEALHDPVRTTTTVPKELWAEIALLRCALAGAIAEHAGTPLEEAPWKALLFLDRLLFATRRPSRGGVRGQKGETLCRTLSRRLAAAWAGSWSGLWQESAQAAATPGTGAGLDRARNLVRDVRAVEEALAGEDTREALRVIDGCAGLARDADARRWLPKLFPEAAGDLPVLTAREPLAEDVQRFQQELASALRHAPRRRAPGPGGSRGEHWWWMPGLGPAWAPLVPALTDLALGRVPVPVLTAVHSARVLAAARPEAGDGKVRPLALGVFLRRCISRAVAKIFGTRVAATLSPVEHAIGKGRGAELMHRTVLLDLDVRATAVKLGFDVSNAHNEFDRNVAASEISNRMPDMVPWVRGCLELAPVHVWRASDGSTMELEKSRGGDQGDALVSLIFPLTYATVSKAVADAVQSTDGDARVYTFQDDMELVCTPAAVSLGRAAFQAGCAHAGLRANRSKDTLALGRRCDPQGLTGIDVKIDPRAIVLRHGADPRVTPVPAAPATTAANGSLLAAGAPEVAKLHADRGRFFARLRDLQAAGLPRQSAMALARLRTGSDFVFLARTCGVPPADAQRLDADLVREATLLKGPGPGAAGADKLALLRLSDGGWGFQSAELTSPSASAASWHHCMQPVLARLGLPSVTALEASSPWAAACVPPAAAILGATVDDGMATLGDPTVHASQHSMASAALAAGAQSVLEAAAADLAAGAALRSSGGPGAGAWMLPPTEAAHRLSDQQFTIALCTRSHHDVPTGTGFCQHRRANGTICGEALDAKGVHARCCPAGGWLVRRHNAGVRVLGDWCEREAGCTVLFEQVDVTASTGHPEARLDLVLWAPRVAGAIRVDFTVAGALSTEALARGSGIRNGVAAALAEQNKHRRYDAGVVHPFAVECHGRLGEEARALIRLLAPEAPQERSVAIGKLQQALAATLQRASADAVIAATTMAQW